MKNIFLSLQLSKENKLLQEKFLNDNNFKIITAEEIKEKKCTVIVNGPLTELASILFNCYKAANNIEEILFVGGSDSYGDITPAAEKNVYADVYSAQAVFLSGIKIIIFGLNITRNFNYKALLPYAYLKDKSVFVTEECGAYIETKGQSTLGKMVIDVYSDKQFEQHNCEIVLEIDKNKIHQYI